MPELEAYIDTICEKYADVFSEPSSLPPDRGIQHASNLVENATQLIPMIPPFQRMYRLSPEEQQEVVRHVSDLLKTGLVEPSTLSYGSPIFVKKKSGDIDYLFDKLHGARYITSLDAMSGFHQILLRELGSPV